MSRPARVGRRSARAGMLLPAAFLTAALLAACSQAEPEKAPEPVRPVLSVLVEPHAGRTQGFVGTVEPQFSANLSFRLLGKVVSRDVEVGDAVRRGATIAALDPTALMSAGPAPGGAEVPAAPTAGLGGPAV